MLRAGASSAAPDRLASCCGRHRAVHRLRHLRGQAARIKPSFLHTKPETTPYAGGSRPHLVPTPFVLSDRYYASTSSSTPATALAALLPFFQSNSATAKDEVWATRVSSALASVSKRPFAGAEGKKEILVLHLTEDKEADGDLMTALLEDGMMDHTGNIPKAVAQARLDLLGNMSLRVAYSEELNWQASTGLLEVPIPWLKEGDVVIKELQASDITRPESKSAMYLASQVLVTCAYSSLFTLHTSDRLLNLIRSLRTFVQHPGLRLTISHSGEVASETDRQTAIRRIRDCIDPSPPSGAPSLRIDFINVSKVHEAQEALRGAMGFRKQEASITSSSSSPSQDRSQLWSDFQDLSHESGLPSLITSLVASNKSQQEQHLCLLISHAAEEITSRLNLAMAELEEKRSWALWLERSAQSDTSLLVRKILSSTPSVTTIPPHSGNEPPLLPKWWKLPFIGDVEARERVHKALEDEWLGGKESEERLIWWSGRLRETHALEERKLKDVVDKLQRDEHRPQKGLEAKEAGGEPRMISQGKSPAIPPSRILEMRSISRVYTSSSRVNLDDPRVLAQPIIRARASFFSRGPPILPRLLSAKAILPESDLSPTEGGESILDLLQRRLQSAIYRFYATIGISWSVAGWGLASHQLFPPIGPTSTVSTSPIGGFSTYLTDILSLPSFNASTSLGIALLGSTYALYALQRSHSRISSKLLTRDLLTRIPANTWANVQERVEKVVAQEIYGWRGKVASIVDRWCETELAVVKEDRRCWESTKPLVLAMTITDSSPRRTSNTSTPSASLSNRPSTDMFSPPSSHSSFQQTRLLSTSSSPPSSSRQTSPPDAASPPPPPSPPPSSEPPQSEKPPPSKHRLFYREVLPAWLKCVSFVGGSYVACHVAWRILDHLDPQEEEEEEEEAEIGKGGGGVGERKAVLAVK